MKWSTLAVISLFIQIVRLTAGQDEGLDVRVVDVGGVEIDKLFRTDRGDNEGGAELAPVPGAPNDAAGDNDVEISVVSGTIDVRYGKRWQSDDSNHVPRIQGNAGPSDVC